jgi:hypothetical protein
LRGGEDRSTGDYNERDKSRPETETSHGNINTIQCSNWKRTLCPSERIARLRPRSLFSRRRRLSN